YRENVKKRSEIMHGDPIKQLDKAVFWTEYVIRHKGAPHLRSAALNLSWYQYLLLDVVAVVVLIIFVPLFVIIKAFKKYCCRKTEKPAKKINKFSLSRTAIEVAYHRASQMGKSTQVLVLFTFILCTVNSSKILGVFHMPAYSHYQLGDRLLKELAARGHEVTVITPYAEKNPVKNFKQVVLTGAIEKLQPTKDKLFEQTESNVIRNIVWLELMGLELVESTLSHPNVQEFLKSNNQFDLVILNQFGNDAFKGFCHYYNAPCVVLSPVTVPLWTHAQIANPDSPAYFPDMYSDPAFDTMNSHISINPAVPYLPNMIDIGGYHVKPPKKLPKDLQEYLDGAKDGVVLFSLGSNLQSKNLPKEKRESILKAFSKLKQKVLWKWEDETLPNQPPNVKLSKWLPQSDVIAHRNIKLLITHGGLLSTTEAIYHGVPIIGIPIFGGQEKNIALAERNRYAILVPYKQLTEEKLSHALNEVINNP
ncbi:hypothetical protein ILUMI_00539, partial [Ignelater luminosus]